MALSLRDQGYLVTDHALHRLLRGLPLLEVLSLQNCSHLTDVSIDNILALAPRLRSLNLIGCTRIGCQALLRCLLGLQRCTLLELSGAGMDKEYLALLTDSAAQRRVRLNIVRDEESRAYLF